MPVTSPPPKLENGIIIPGLLCPGLSSQTVSPESAYNKYIKPTKNYAIVHKNPDDADREFIDNSLKTEKARGQVALKIMRDIDWDIFSVQMQSTDAFQHRFWGLLDSDEGSENAALRRQALEFYRTCDRVIRDLVEESGNDTLTTIVSDHGFCSGRSTIGINVWLRQNGYLTLLHPEPPSKWAKIKYKYPLLKHLAKHLGPLINRSKKPDRKELYCKTVLSHLRRIVDFNKTTAFCVGGMGGMLYINAQGRDNNRISEEVKTGLMKEFGPESSNPVIEKILPAKEVYSNSESIDTTPDLVIYFADGVEHRINPTGDEVVFDKTLDGTHDKEGIFVASGNDVKHMQVDCDIIDIAPTVLAWIGVAVPSNMDGKVLKDIFTVEVDELREDMVEKSKGKVKYSDAEQAAVEKQLKDMGYL